MSETKDLSWTDVKNWSKENDSSDLKFQGNTLPSQVARSSSTVMTSSENKFYPFSNGTKSAIIVLFLCLLLFWLAVLYFKNQSSFISEKLKVRMNGNSTEYIRVATIIDN